MNNCFKCSKKVEIKGEVYYLITKINSADEKTFNIFSCNDCWDQVKQDIETEKDKEIVSALGYCHYEGEDQPQHQQVYLQNTCQKCHKYQKALCHCDNTFEDGWRCLDCGKKGEIEGSGIEDKGSCLGCGKLNIEVKIPNNHVLEIHGLHYTLHACSGCGKVKDLTVHNAPNFSISKEEVKNKMLTNAKENQETFWRLCNCNSRERERESKNDNWKSYLPWILGGVGIIVVIIGLVWLVNKNKKDKI